MAGVTRDQRYTRTRRCPVCGGAETDPRGAGKRCTGYLSPDGRWARCSRDEHAGNLVADDRALYVHMVGGACKCGVEHAPATSTGREIEATYDYLDEHGKLLFQVVRYVGKDFRQRAPDGAGGWVWKLEGVKRVLYKLPELLAADPGTTVYIGEGEKDVDALRRHGLVATCNPHGAGKWSAVKGHGSDVLSGRNVVIVADKDDAGRKHAQQVAEALHGEAMSVRVIEVERGKDAADHFGQGGTVGELFELVTRAPFWAPAPPTQLNEHGQHEEFFADAPAAGETMPEGPWEKLVAPVRRPWFEEPPAPRTWLLRDARRSKADGVLPLGKVGQLIAEGGAGKTMLVCQLALAVATGERWLGVFEIATRGRVLLLLGEEEEEEVHRRMYRARQSTQGPIPEDDAIVSLPLSGTPVSMLEKDQIGNLTETFFLEWLRRWVKAKGPWALVVVDPLSRFAGPDAEIDNAAATRFIQALEAISKETGATVLVAHHTTKASRAGGAVNGSSGRGSSALFDGARWQASLGIEKLDLKESEERERLGQIAVLTVTKSNYSRIPDPVLLRRDQENGGALLLLDDDDQDVVGKVRSGQSAAEAREAHKEAERRRKVVQDAVALVVYARENPDCTARSARAVLFADSSKRWSSAAAMLGRCLIAGSAGMQVDPTKVPPEIAKVVAAVDAARPRPTESAE